LIAVISQRHERRVSPRGFGLQRLLQTPTTAL